MDESEPNKPIDEEKPAPQMAEQSLEKEPAAPETAITPVVEPAPEEAPAEKPRESRLGHFMRIGLRWLVLAAFLFAAGVLTSYFVLYQPTLAQANRLATELNQTHEQLSVTEKNLQTAQDQAKTLQSQYDQAKVDLEIAQNRAYLQMILTNIANTRLALVNKDGPAARVALMAAQTDLERLIPAIEKKDAGLADAVSGRLSLVLNEINRDPRTAISDLDILTRNLQDLEKVLFQS